MELVLPVGDRADPTDGATYRQRFQTIGETSHQSCLLLTARVWPRQLAILAGDDLPVRCLHLTGLPVAASRELLQTTGL
ncbi:MAG: hypothetical protein ACFB12_08220 [Leptolyngbyaceae cyanobacterium]